ncbi:MAG: bifunctional DNA-formamidopyrimidine glycosylase/DNA-(apurinic or apyrimidinic site) lyase [Gammaproteobacteria bacterium]|jgi:formamidopyrimidine-DNA glycosylase|nr:bifunctional DNA-formamidopyrimidine glycosylase/DNA-(apurinic or apyrimidinic site) lyase [Gammaproteobacteria bacterium]NCW57574.1 bifunctional DNA-formamidopyrimidine glycosylase/DNA-(apurinic or apyrimidinic site) lyase [Gammaproteobacteria bacterium]NDB26008.1 bifunctional DNA-formamidopyrimidine glycosylase/DNA-(apurinic or apyrimidinic site) lyase [Gammaproteobacteria bacterium]NDF86917.1 bifunctional DNA-formamidopyrimidine glycosylase/DNA-(apurinic or apyrimidinic site) lyase [Gammap
MPELPEVETTCRGIAPHVCARRIEDLLLHETRLRWPVSRAIVPQLRGAVITNVRRRAKYLLLEVARAGVDRVGVDSRTTLILHLGMSGNLRVLPQATPRLKHDHFDLLLDSGMTLRFNDPRRFGSLHLVSGDPNGHPLLAKLGPEPLDDAFDAEYLWRSSRSRRIAVKPFLMNGHVVVGVGNIYASEALFRAGVRPGRQARHLKHDEITRIVDAIKQVLAMAIKVGGTTLRDYVGADGTPGYFRQKLFVYERAGEPCRKCGEAVRHRVQGQRSTYWCHACQR